MDRKIFLTSLALFTSVFAAEPLMLVGPLSTMQEDITLNTTLHATPGSHFFTGNITLDQDSLIHTEAGSTLALLGGISGKGDFIKTGGGTAVVLGNYPNSMGGQSIVKQGVLALNKKFGAALRGNIHIEGGSLVVMAPGQIGRGSPVTLLSGSLELQGVHENISVLHLYEGQLHLPKGSRLSVGALQLRGDLVIQGTDASIDGNIDLGGEMRSIVIPQGNIEIGSAISSGGIVKQGEGTLHLSGESTYKGPTDVRNGILLVTGSLGATPLTVHPGAQLQGSGQVASVVNQGTVQPMRLVLKGSFTQTEMGLTHFLIHDSSDYSRLVVKEGGVALSGAALVDFSPSYSIEQTDRLLLIDNTEGPGITGTFDRLTINNTPAGYTAFLDYNLDALFLSVLKDPEIAPPLPSCYISLSPVVFATTDEKLTSLTRKMTSLRNHRHEGVQLYADGIGSAGRVKKCGGTDPFHYSSGGGRIGVDNTFSRGAVGGAVSYEEIRSYSGHPCTSFSLGSVTGDLYGTISPISVPEFFVEGVAGAGYQYYDIHRHTTIAKAKGHSQGYSYNFLLDFGYQARGKEVYFVPSAGLEWLGMKVEGYREHRASTDNLHIHDQISHALRSNVAATLGYRIARNDWQVIPEIRGIWRHDFERQRYSLPFSVESSGTSSHFHLLGAGRNSYLFGAQLMLLGTEFQMHASYDYTWNRRIFTQFFEFGVGWHF